MIGQTLGHYQIVAKIGEGGMGEVYQARDTKLDRDVALKVLPEAFTSDPDRLARFEREAKVLASLNHTNIGHIYGLEEAEPSTPDRSSPGQVVRALVLELVEGPTLADRVKQGPIPVDEALPIARQIAEGLEAAHEAGVIHRDLKPANIKVREDGTVKVLDFGLAKALVGDESQPDLSQSPTVTGTVGGGTREGVILGTAAYMSPEQARGKPVDRRTDIWAYGCVLFEMLTGRAAFAGETLSDTIANVLQRESDWQAVPEGVSPGLATYLRRCLEKNPRRRVQAIGDVRLALEGAFELADAPSRSQVRAWQRPAPLLLAGLLIATVTGLAVWPFARTGPPGATVARFSVMLPPGDLPGLDLAVSPDGATIVYVGVRDGVQLLFARDRDELTPQPLPGTEDASAPFFSPDGAAVGFFAGGSLKRADLNGGMPRVLTRTALRPGVGSWSADGTIVFASAYQTPPGLMQVSAEGGESRSLTTPDAGDGLHLSPSFVPGTRSVVYTVGQLSQPSELEVQVISLESGEHRTLVKGSSATVTTGGHLVFAREGALWAASFDADTMTLTGEPVPLVQDVEVNTADGKASYAVANDGTLAYLPSGLNTGADYQLTWVDRGGRETSAWSSPLAFREFSLSPDGAQVAVRISRPDDTAVWVLDLDRNTETRVTFEDDPAVFPTWTRDGKRLAFGSPPSWTSADGTGEVEFLSDVPGVPNAFAANGTLVINLRGAGSDLGLLEPDGDGTIVPLLNEPFVERNAALSPDGRWIAYESNETGRNEVSVRPFPDVDGDRWRISAGGGAQPVWHPDGEELFFVGPDRLMAVAYESEPTFTPGTVTPLFDLTPYRARMDSLDNRRIAVEGGGGRFLLLKSLTGQLGAPATAPRINVVLHWFTELSRLVPVP